MNYSDYYNKHIPVTNTLMIKLRRILTDTN